METITTDAARFVEDAKRSTARAVCFRERMVILSYEKLPDEALPVRRAESGRKEMRYENG